MHPESQDERPREARPGLRRASHGDSMMHDRLQFGIERHDMELLLSPILCQPGKLLLAVFHRHLAAIDTFREATIVVDRFGDSPSKFDPCHDLAVSRLGNRARYLLHFTRRQLSQQMQLIRMRMANLSPASNADSPGRPCANEYRQKLSISKLFGTQLQELSRGLSSIGVCVDLFCRRLAVDPTGP